MTSKGAPYLRWLKQEVVSAYDVMKADPSRGRSVAEVRSALAAEYERALNADQKVSKRQR
ncbi:MAG: hypothetical protein AB7P20_07725 [Rhizobiaceae bacterium]